MRIVFAGTPNPAVPSLQRLIDSHKHDVVAVLTRPDAVSGRGRKVARSPIGVLADEHGIPVLTPQKPGDDDFVAELRALEPDCCPVVAYGALLPPPVLAIPKLGWINLHFSLLPAWRGAAPVQAAIDAGDEITGATTFLLEAGLDTGPVFGVVTERIRADDTTGELLGRLADTGAQLLESTVDGVAAGALTAIPQSGDGVSFAPKITNDLARIRWDRPALAVDRHIRSVTPTPGAWTSIGGARVKVGPVTVAAGIDQAAGTIELRKDGVHVGTGSVPVRLDRIQPPGKKMMSAADWARGARLEPGAVAE